MDAWPRNGKKYKKVIVFIIQQALTLSLARVLPQWETSFTQKREYTLGR